MNTTTEIMNTTTRAPFFIVPKVISEMTDEQLDEMLKAARDARIEPARIHEEKVKMQEAAAVERMSDQCEREFKMLEKELGQMDRIIEKLTQRVIRIRSMRIRMGMDI